MLVWLKPRIAALLEERARPHIVHLPAEHAFFDFFEEYRILRLEQTTRRVDLLSLCMEGKILVKLKDGGPARPTTALLTTAHTLDIF